MKSIFDIDDVSDISEELKISRGRQDTFGICLHELFIKAKREGYQELNIDQITVAYHRFFVLRHRARKKTAVQIMNKMLALASQNKFNIKKVKGKNGTYYLDEKI